MKFKKENNKKRNSLNLKNTGFGLIGLMITLVIICFLVFGGFYFNNLKQKQSLIETGQDAKKQAEELNKIIGERNREINNNGLGE